MGKGSMMVFDEIWKQARRELGDLTVRFVYVILALSAAVSLVQGLSARLS